MQVQRIRVSCMSGRAVPEVCVEGGIWRSFGGSAVSFRRNVNKDREGKEVREGTQLHRQQSILPATGGRGDIRD